MSETNFSKSITEWARVQQAGNSSSETLPVYGQVYDYSSLSLQEKVPGEEKFLHLYACSSPTVRKPIKISFRQGDYAVLISVHKGSCVINSDNVIPEGGSRIIFANEASFLLSSIVLPLSFHLLIFEGEPLSLYTPVLMHAFAAYQTKESISEGNPIIQHGCERLLNLPLKVTVSSLYEMHMILTVILNETTRKALGNKDSTAVSEPDSGSAEETGIQSGPTNKPLPSYLIFMHQQVHSQYQEPFSLTQCEHQYGVSQYRLCREYTKAFGISPVRDLTKTRMEKAGELLMSPTLQVQEISSMVGYDNVSHFIELFHKETGMTPGAFRTRYQS